MSKANLNEQSTSERTNPNQVGERFESRLGFILISAGCAIGLCNIWCFPYIVGKNGGAIFVLIYLVFLLLIGLPIMTTEFAIGRASQRTSVRSFHVLPKKSPRKMAYNWLCCLDCLLSFA